MNTARITWADYGISPDDRDRQILADRVAEREKIAGPRIGDIIIFADGGSGRFAYGWEGGMQTTLRPYAGGSFYLCESGGMSFSGSLEPCIPRARIADTGNVELATAWFFHHGFPCAHSAVHALIPCRVYRETEESKT